jgi:2-dehydro-3-deoxyphosphogluconate aldolase/(4S)-4-hydroxy-2-oxoglutarate aldolase
MSTEPVFETLTRHAVVPVIAIDDAGAAIPLADALLEGGLPVAEITFRTRAAGEVLERIAAERPECVVGAGTVLTPENLDTAMECGARFAVAPGTNPDVVRHAASRSLPFMPGVATPSEIEQAMALGCTVLKFFPAGALGGPAMLKALSGPYQHTGVRFVPTGGVTAGNLHEYLSLPVVAAVGGTWIATRDDIAQGRWKEVTARCREAVAAVDRIRSGA